MVWPLICTLSGAGFRLGCRRSEMLERASVQEKRSRGRQVRELSAVDRLARFFPDASPVRIPVSIHFERGENPTEPESTVIEFGTPREALFGCSRHLEFADKVRLQNGDGSLAADAWVVAVHYHQGEAAVAARFSQEVKNWVIKS